MGERKVSEFNKVLGIWEILVMAFGAMIGWAGLYIVVNGLLKAASLALCLALSSAVL